MALHYILDGYNIIKSGLIDFSNCRTLEEQRQSLISMLKNNAPQGSLRNKITVVFDGTFENYYFGGDSLQNSAADIKVIFSRDETADEKIVKLVNSSSGKPELVIVTNDKGLRRLIAGTGVKFMSVPEFKDRIFKLKQKTGTVFRDKVDPETARDIDKELRDKWLK